MTAQIVIRPGTAGDVEEVLMLEREVAEAPHWSRAEYEAMIPQADERGGVLRCLMVAEVEGRLAGFAAGKVVIAAESGELESVAVRRAARRIGVGMRLCQAVIDWCKLQGATSIELEVRSASFGAKRLYERVGFVAEGVRKAYYREPEDDAVLMRLDLGKCG